MAFAGLKKQLNKANQYMSEKMGAAEGTKLTEEYLDMEKKTDVTMELVDEMINKTKEYLQPNPATRAKMQLSNRVQTGGRGYGYTQPEGVLGDSMLRSAKKLGDNVFAQSLTETGEALKQMSEIKFALEDNIKQNFLEPLTYLQNKEIKDVNFHRKKLESRRLDYDCKKRRKPTSQAEQVDLSLAQAKFEQSLNLASQGMHNLLQNQTEHINQLTALSQALHEYHLQCATILEGLTSRLNEKKNIAANQPQEAYVTKKLDDFKNATNNQSEGSNFSSNNDLSKENGLLMNFNTDSTSTNLISEPQNKNTPTLTNLDNASPSSQSSDNTPEANRTSPALNNKANNKIPAVPCCRALYDFEPENPTELAFEEGDIIELKEKIDENWFEGTLKGKTGLFPIAYVTILVPINK